MCSSRSAMWMGGWDIMAGVWNFSLRISTGSEGATGKLLRASGLDISGAKTAAWSGDLHGLRLRLQKITSLKFIHQIVVIVKPPDHDEDDQNGQQQTSSDGSKNAEQTHFSLFRSDTDLVRMLDWYVRAGAAGRLPRGHLPHVQAQVLRERTGRVQMLEKKQSFRIEYV